MNDIRYCEDVKEVAALAARLARREKREAPADRDYLRCLPLIHRKFNRLDGLLQELSLPIASLRRELKNVKSAPPPAPTSDLLKNAELLAGNARDGNAASQPVTVEVAHLLQAFCLSADPVVRTVMDAHRLTPEAIGKAAARARAKRKPRLALFIAKELLEVVFFVLAFLIIIKSFLGELRLIPSESMVPGLQVDDRLVIERVTRWVPVRPYQRGDILVFYPPMTRLRNDPWSIFLRLTGFSGLMFKKEDNIDVAYIKRLIGLPGDRVRVVRGGGVYVNGRRLIEPYVNEIAYTCTIMPADSMANEEAQRAQNLAPTCGEITVPPGHYFMMGDNRNQSLDSRYWGFADDERVIGRAIFRIWPFPRLGPLDPVPYQSGSR